PLWPFFRTFRPKTRKMAAGSAQNLPFWSGLSEYHDEEIEHFRRRRPVRGRRHRPDPGRRGAPPPPPPPLLARQPAALPDQLFAQLRPRAGARHLRLLRRPGHGEMLPECSRLYRPGWPPAPLLLSRRWQDFAGSDKRPTTRS